MKVQSGLALNGELSGTRTGMMPILNHRKAVWRREGDTCSAQPKVLRAAEVILVSDNRVRT